MLPRKPTPYIPNDPYKNDNARVAGEESKRQYDDMFGPDDPFELTDSISDLGDFGDQ